MQQRTEVVDDASWVMGFLDILDPAIDTLKRLLKLDSNAYTTPLDSLRNIAGKNRNKADFSSDEDGESDFDLDAFIMDRLSFDSSNLEVQLGTPKMPSVKRYSSPRRIWKKDMAIK